ncbi:glucosamine-6-phosphate deaminase [Hoyosella rhizosphaerae]|uniref:Glucosamine-6-phosphate deaminase n=1 Tax=Hoyosella rhizosphaerae TaxID=1755582 RepID=A0A916U7L3_9ACTN|nr:glucosamine-6-phosphate deaminase [Hoyosella rhizosphaerae]MBN4927654.1 glucosamine-6-phosphate deaminase [Hoyosella rhizosphaerae]GGC62753.1 glucosamine-6-phosphate deaminase [Hoyosella rhizosphaerae]
MRVLIEPDEAAVARTAANAVAPLVRHATCNLGVATGSSPVPTYRELARRCASGELNFSGVHVFLLDEYAGLPQQHPQSYFSTIRRDFTTAVGIPDDHIHGPDGYAENVFEEAAQYDRHLTEVGGIDVQILGIGRNGHIGFNEPMSSLASRTHVAVLTNQTRQDNSRFFAAIDDVPRRAITQGLATISEARSIVLIATGPAKSSALAAAIEGPLSARCPASVLQLHPNVTIIADEEAAQDLEFADYYRQRSAH